MSVEDGILLVLFAGLVLSLIAVTRASYRLLDPHGTNRDGYAHLLFIAEIRTAGHRIPEYLSVSALSGRSVYPYFLHWVLSFFPSRWLPIIERYFSPLMDLLFAAVLLSLYPLGLLSTWQTVFAITLFLVTPQFMRFDMAHGIGLSSRKPGQLLTTISLLLFSLWSIGGANWLFVAGVFGGALICLTSKFSVQSLVFILFGMGLVVDSLFLLAIPLSLGLAVLLSLGAYWDILRGHVSHLKHLALKGQFRLRAIQRRSVLQSLHKIINNLRSGDIKAVARRGFDNLIVRVISDNPFILLLPLIVAARWGTGFGTPTVFTVWLFTGIITFVLTSLPYLRFIGEGERYLEYVFLPAVLVIADGLKTIGPWFTVVTVATMGFGAVVIPLYFKGYQLFLYDSDEGDDWGKVREYLESQDQGVVLLQPKGRGRQLAWETHHIVVDPVMNAGDSTDEIDSLCPEMYGIITDDVRWLEETFDPDWVIFELGRSYPEGSLKPNDAEPVLNTEDYQLYRFEQLKSNRTN
ncbi:hypothetical protein [Haloarchaeobius litoreus]|uniref:Dolichyl-phosphate-mannose-protein mannosyltransferase n=1 Tax=Haloarchaeobius litoreus TaxID=755306 RepID=A0ABD6DIF0_9EURY|nr:hypothetical protein [Haloarchaeobius litoreus]